MKRLHVHVGVDDRDAKRAFRGHGRLKTADRPVFEEGATTCCYAKSEKSWIADPDGVVWEAFLTNGEATVYGDSPALGTLGDSLSEDKCCLPMAVRAA